MSSKKNRHLATTLGVGAALAAVAVLLKALMNLYQHRTTKRG